MIAMDGIISIRLVKYVTFIKSQIKKGINMAKSKLVSDVLLFNALGTLKKVIKDVL